MSVSFAETLKMVAGACKREFLDGTYAKEKTIIECATKIYIELKRKERDDSNDKNET